MISRADTTTESVVSLPVINPDPKSKGRSRTFRFMGKVDAIDEGRIIDWKTCSDPARFIQTLGIGLQPELYALACEHHGHSISEIGFRLLRRPEIKFCGKDTDDDGKFVVQIYEDRCLKWMLDAPGKMVTHNLTLSKARLDQARVYLWDCSKRILDNRRNDRWIANEMACFDWNRACSYLPLCECVSCGGDHEWVIREQYTTVEDSHPELDGASAGLSVLTYSSMKDLSQCEMLYNWQHEQRLRKRSDYSEALWIGSAMHVGIEAFATGGLDAARTAIAEWDDANPTIGADATHLAKQNVAKAMAMVRAAAVKWN